MAPTLGRNDQFSLLFHIKLLYVIVFIMLSLFIAWTTYTSILLNQFQARLDSYQRQLDAANFNSSDYSSAEFFNFMLPSEPASSSNIPRWQKQVEGNSDLTRSRQRRVAAELMRVQRKQSLGNGFAETDSPHSDTVMNGDSIRNLIQERESLLSPNQDLNTDGISNGKPKPDSMTAEDWLWMSSYSRVPIAALEKFCESASETCPAGPPGPRGPKGEKGALGTVGLPGAAGPPGPAGEDGLQGVKGDRGERGVKGEKGPKSLLVFMGSKGDFGPKGDKGNKGDGVVGMPGQKGPEGRTGPKGEDGTPGPKGIPGVTGQRGMVGAIGYPGPKGEMGWPGAKGGRGEKGFKGDKGSPGSSLDYGVSLVRPDQSGGGLPFVPEGGTDLNPGDAFHHGSSTAQQFKRSTPTELFATAMTPQTTPQRSLNEIPDDRITQTPPPGPDATPQTRFTAEKRKWDCLVRRIGKGVVRKLAAGSRAFYGAWMMDVAPVRARDRDTVWVTRHMHGRRLTEFRSMFEFSKEQPSRQYMLPEDAPHYFGTGHLIYSGAFIYNRAGSGELIRYGLREKRVVARHTIVNASYDTLHGQPLFTPEIGYNFFKFSADKHGLWVIYAPQRVTHLLRVQRVDPFRLEPIGAPIDIPVHHPDYAHGFVVCGVLYLIKAPKGVSDIDFAYDLYRGVRVTIPDRIQFVTGYRKTTQASYNPRLNKIFAWDYGNKVDIPLLTGPPPTDHP